MTEDATNKEATLDGQKAPLLPPTLTGANAYLWLWVLPIGLLLILNLQSYWLIEGNMDGSQRQSAYWLGFFNLVNVLVGLGVYFFFKARDRSKPSNTLLALPAIAVQIAYLWHATAISHEMLPDSVTLWIYPPSRYFYHQYAFCMLPLFWGIIQVACGNFIFLSRRISINLAMAIGAPLCLYLLFFVLYKAFSDWFFDISPIFVSTLVIGLGLVMFVGIIRVLMLIFGKLGDWNPLRHIIVILLIALAMPIGGLLLNRSIPFPVNFQAWEVYALVVANTILLIGATLFGNRAPRLSFLLICGSFPFTLYFFVVFLPYTPLSILGCIAMGAGFLVLTPTFLFTLHTYQLIRTRRIARENNHRSGLLVGSLLCFLILPGFFTARGMLDKAALNAALDFTFTPDLTSESIEYPGNRANLRRALANHRDYKNGIYYPLLSDYYSWLVFDNLVLPDKKIEVLEQRFFGSKGSTENLDSLSMPIDFWRMGDVRSRNSMPRARPPLRNVTITDQTLELTALSGQSAKATLILELTNKSPGGGEYINKLSVPPGVLVNGFRLHIEGTPVPGRIFEKKTALWVYTMIRDMERRDPGLLVYNHPSEIELRVFPVNRGSPATVEIDFLIPDSVDAITPPESLPDPAGLVPLLYPTIAQVANGEDFTYIAPMQADELPQVPREKFLHLILDRSRENGFEGSLQEAMQLAKDHFPDIEDTKVTLANYNVVPISEDEYGLERLPISGGLDLDKALAQSIAQYTAEYLNKTDGAIPKEPIFVVISRAGISELPELERTNIWKSHLSELEIHSITRGGDQTLLTGQKAQGTPLIRVGDAIRSTHVYRSMIFPASDAPPEYFDPSGPGEWRILEHNSHQLDAVWTEAITLWVNNHRYAASPGSAPIVLKSLVQASRETGVLIPATSYIVVENEAQWRMLEKKEAQKLEQNEALDFLETPAPSTIFIVVGFAAWLVWRRRVML